MQSVGLVGVYMMAFFAILIFGVLAPFGTAANTPGHGKRSRGTWVGTLVAACLIAGHLGWGVYALSKADAVEDVADVDFDKTVIVDVLNNDTDPDGDSLSVESIVQPTVGSAILNNDGTILFNPEGNIGSISVLYTVTDGRGGKDSATLTIASTDPNDGNDAYPDITNEVVSTPKNTPIFIDVLANDTDADGDVLVLDQVDQGENGTTTKVNGGVLYTPNPGFTGTDIFYYGVHDGHGHNGSGNVKVSVTQ